MRYCITPAPRRRATMPTARRIATPTNSARMASSPPTSTTPSSKAGSTTWSVDQPSTHASATVSAPNRRLPSVESVKIHGSRRMATPSTAKPSRNVPRGSGGARDAGLLTTPPYDRPMTSLARTERVALCRTALQVGEDQPTLSGEWTVKDLVVHLLVREGSPAALGILVKPLEKVLDLEMRRVGRRPFNVLVEKLRHGPPRWSPYAVPKLDATLNTLEYFVHHEDIRRAQPAWTARDLDAESEKLLWAM